MDYVVMNEEGFAGYRRGEIITFGSVATVNEAIAMGAKLALPHSSAIPPVHSRGIRNDSTDDENETTGD